MKLPLRNMKQKISTITLPRHFAIQFWPKPSINEMCEKSLFCSVYQIKDESKNSKRIENLNNSEKNSLKNFKIFFKSSAYFQFGFCVYLILFKVVTQLSSIFF